MEESKDDQFELLEEPPGRNTEIDDMYLVGSDDDETSSEDDNELCVFIESQLMTSGKIRKKNSGSNDF